MFQWDRSTNIIHHGGWCFKNIYYSSWRNLSGSLKDLKALNLSGNYQGEPRFLPHCCTKPQEPTINATFQKKLVYSRSIIPFYSKFLPHKHP